MKNKKKLISDIAVSVFPQIINFWQGKKPQDVIIKDCVAMSFDYADAMVNEIEKRNALN